MGRLTKRPIAAAPKAWVTSSVSVKASSPKVGARQIPEMAANAVPIIHAHWRTRVGLMPVLASKLGLSTTARIAIPCLDHRKNQYSSAVAAIENVTVIIWSQPTYTPSMATVVVGRKLLTIRGAPG